MSVTKQLALLEKIYRHNTQSGGVTLYHPRPGEAEDIMALEAASSIALTDGGYEVTLSGMQRLDVDFHELSAMLERKPTTPTQH